MTTNSANASELLERLRNSVTTDRPRHERAHLAASAIRDDTNARWVGIYTVDRDGVHNAAWSGPGAPAYPDFPATSGLTAHAIASRSIAVSNDVGRDPRYLANQDDSGSELIIPILIDGRVVGTLDIESDQTGAFDGVLISRYEAAARCLVGLWTHRAHTGDRP